MTTEYENYQNEIENRYRDEKEQQKRPRVFLKFVKQKITNPLSSGAASSQKLSSDSFSGPSKQQYQISTFPFPIAKPLSSSNPKAAPITKATAAGSQFPIFVENQFKKEEREIKQQQELQNRMPATENRNQGYFFEEDEDESELQKIDEVFSKIEREFLQKQEEEEETTSEQPGQKIQPGYISPIPRAESRSTSVSSSPFSPPPNSFPLDVADDIKLDEAQRQCVTSDPSAPLLIVAGPGGGKTRVIVHRIAWMIREQRVSPRNILCITFTTKASKVRKPAEEARKAS